MRKIFFLSAFLILILSLAGFVFAEQKCSFYSKDGVREEHCANCGDKICEPYEKCTSSNCGKDMCTADCGGLYCPEDCERKVKCKTNEDCGKERLEYSCSESYKCLKLISPICKNSGTENSYCTEEERETKTPCVYCSNGCENGECSDGISIKIPSSFSLLKEQTAKIANYQDMKIKLTGIFINPECKTEPCPGAYFREYVKVEISIPGGCGPNADPSCLGNPGYSDEVTIPDSESVEVLGIRLTLKQKDNNKADFYIEFLSKKESTCGNKICEEGEADEYNPGGCGADTDSRCLGIPASFKPGTCPEDCRNKKIKSREKEVKTEMELSEEKIDNKTKIKIKLSNGKKSEIKIMPETASEKAIEVLELRVCNEENNCIIELKEVGKNNELKAVYKIEAEKQGRFFGLFKIKSRLETQIDVETGEVIRTKKPWWNFLVFRA